MDTSTIELVGSNIQEVVVDGGTVRVDTEGEGDATKLAFTFLPPERGALPPANQEPVLAE